MIYNYSFDPEKYLKLIKKQQQLIATGTGIGRYLKEAERFELEDYSRQIFDYLVYQRRYSFLTLIKNFLQNEIDSDDFYIEYSQLTSKLGKMLLLFSSVEKLKKVQNYPEAYPFSILISSLNLARDLYDVDGFPDPQNDLKNWVLREYKSYLSSDSAIDVDIELDLVQLEGSSNLPLLVSKTKNSNYNDSQVLREVMILGLIVVSIVFYFLKS